MKNLQYILILVGALIVLGLLYGFSLSKQHQARFVEVNIDIAERHDRGFVDQQLLEKLLTHQGNYILGQVMDSVNIQELEERVRRNPFVKHAEAYSDLEGKFYLNVDQRKPVMRVVSNDGIGIYIDEDGYSMPVSDLFTAKVIPCTGVKLNQKYLNSKTSIQEDTTLSNIWQVANAINAEPLFSKQFVQMDVDQHNDIVLIPRVGNHEIRIGSAKNIEKKLNKLNAFYQKGINQSNWNIYKTVDLSFDGQIVCKKR